jgi:hypothetical protein
MARFGYMAGCGECEGDADRACRLLPAQVAAVSTIGADRRLAKDRP